MKNLFSIAVIMLLSFGAANAQCLSDQIIGKRWVCVGKEDNGERVRFDQSYFYLTLESDNRFTKSSYDTDGGRSANFIEGTYAIGDCHLLLSSAARSVQEGVMRRIEEYDVTFNNDHYMTLSVTINGVLTRTYYCVYAGKPDEHRYGGTRRKN